MLKLVFICVGTLLNLCVSSLPAFAADTESATIVTQSGVSLPATLPLGLKPTLDTVRIYLANSDEMGCGWRAEPLTLPAKQVLATEARLSLARLTQLSGIAAPVLVKTATTKIDGVPALEAEFTADVATPGKATFSRRIVMVLKAFEVSHVLVTGYCVAPAAKFDEQKAALQAAARLGLPANIGIIPATGAAP